MGDSLTDPKSHGGKYLDYLRQHCPESTFISFGKGADMVNQMRRRFQSQVLAPVPVAGKSHYTDVIIFGGVNDLYSDLTAHRTVEKISADLSAMYQMSRDRGIRVVAITVSPWGGFKRYHNDRRQAATLRLSEFIFEQQRQQQVDFVVDTVPLLSCGDPEHLCPAMAKPFRDGLHFGPKGHEILGAALLKTAFQNCR
ncbi:MAG: SGNH/GDSL hydrolase family protein [Polyangiaceae bacterium]|nr:SGNH/GDSL hydrolase family protein [Polyangiaceae bacterium]